MNSPRRVTPATEDGRLLHLEATGPRTFRCAAEFQLTDALAKRLEHAGVDLVFAARSRICRLGIAITPLQPFQPCGRRCVAEFEGQLHIPTPGLLEHVWDALQPGFPIGRLVVRDRRRRLDAESVLRAQRGGTIRLPKNFSLTSDGGVIFPAQSAVYDFREPLSRHDVLKILTHPDGKEYLDALQARRTVPTLILHPGEAVIAACAMFLTEHIFILDTEDNGLGQHLHARVLDPIQTRSARVFLEFLNAGKSPVVNPTAMGRLYRADEEPAGAGAARRVPAHVARASVLMAPLLQPRQLPPVPRRAPRARAAAAAPVVGISPSWEALAVPCPESAGNRSRPIRSTSESHAARVRFTVPGGLDPRERYLAVHETLQKLPAASSTLIASSLPGAAEHAALLPSMAAGRIRDLVFAQAAIDNDGFLSEADLVHLNDYLELGVEVYWQHPAFRTASKLVRKNRRAFFARPDALVELEDSLVIAVYGSSAPPRKSDNTRFLKFLRSMSTLAGRPLGFLTGGGGGVMQEAADFARRTGALIGANFLEGADALIEPDVAFFQMFQSGARHMRQRWFEVARFHVFAVGGVGTLEEIGLTLTDIKLGLLPTEPLILFGESASGLYWSALVEQLKAIVAERRGPDWLRTHVLATSDPDEAISFVYRSLEVT